MTRKKHGFSKKKTLSVLICLSLTASMLTGCWDNRELNDIGLASGTGYDWENNQWKAVYQVINPSAVSTAMTGSLGGNSISPPFLTFTVYGSTILDAVAKTNLTSTRQLFFAHSRVCVISEKLAKRGISQILDLFLRKPDARETVYVFVTERKPEDILNQLLQITKNQGAGLQIIMEQEEQLDSYYPGMRLFELSIALASESQCAAVPEIKLTGEEVMDKVTETEITDLPSRMALGRLGIFKKDRFVGWLSVQEAFGLSFLSGKIKTASIPFPSSPGLKKNDSSFSLLHSKTKIKPHWEEDHFVMDVNVKGGGNLVELGSKADLSDPKTVARLEQEIEKQVLKRVNQGWAGMQRLDADAAGFAALVHQKYPKRWRQIKQDDNWDEIFKQVEIRPHVSMEIDRFGLSSKSYETIKKN